MNRSHLWKALFVVFIIIWSFSEILPPRPRNLVQEFDRLAIASDTNFNAIIAAAEQLEVEYPDRGGYRNLLEAIGTNDIRPYFPTNYLVSAELNPTRAILNRVQREAAGKFKLGLDLQGGTSFLLEMDLSRRATDGGDPLAGKAFLTEQAVEVLRKRVDAFGVAEPILQPVGDQRIMVQLPGVDEATKESAREQLKKAAFLEFRLVDADNDLHVNSLIPPGYMRLPMKTRTRDGQESMTHILVRRQAEALTGKSITDARVTRNIVTGQPEIHFTLDSEGATIFGEITRNNVGQRLAIVLDGVVISAPTINGPILTGSGQIMGQFTEKEAFELATALENPLEAPLQIVEERGVSPRLGAEQIQAGIRACLIAVASVSAFMLVYYLLAGLVANVALVMNVLILLAVMNSLDVTYTLPGVAGIVLTIGMAVDANVLIFERIREEQAAGKSVRGALNAGYEKAFSTILDSNLTTLISSILLIILGTGPVKGFGVSLSIGLAVSMFTALVVTRLIFDFLLAKTRLLSGGIKMLQLIKETKIDFMRIATPASFASWILILAGVGYAIFGRGEKLLGIDFAGGDTLTLSFAQRIEISQIREELDKIEVTDAEVDYPRDVAGQAGQNEVLRIVSPRDTGIKVEQQLKTAFPEANFERVQFDQVGPVVGQAIQQSAILAGLLSMFGILVYVAFRYEFSFAVGSVVAIIHDVLMTVAIFALTGLGAALTGGWIEARQFDANFVAALLTIIGFSINDTIVIFDRIREDLKLGLPGTFKDIINKALNQTLSRTIITSGTVFLATLALYLFGGRTINNFAFTFLVGILTGTYSTIYIASALLHRWHKGQRPALGAGAVTTVSVPQEVRA